MMKNTVKRWVCFLLSVIMLLQLIPVGVTRVEAATTKAATDLTSAINGLSSPITQSNKLLDNVTVSNTGLLVGTYYIVHKDASGNYRVMDPLCLSNGTNVAATPVTVSGTSVNGADPSMAVDITYDSSNTYYLHTGDGRYLREYAYGNTPCIVVSNHKSLAFGINFYGTSTAYQAHSVRIYRNFAVNGAAKTFDLHYNGSSEFGWIQNVAGQYPVTHQFFLYKIAQRWDTSELYNAIQAMKSYASANNGRFAEGIHAAFMECMEKSINLYKTYNVATGSQTYEQVVAIRSELKAQTEWLLSYKDVLQASYADAAAAIPTPTNTYVPVSWGSWTIELMDQLRDGTYFVVNHGENATTGHVVDLSQEYHVNDLIVAQDVEIFNGKVLNADPNWAIYFEDVNNSNGSRNRYYTAFKPINGLRVALETTPAGSDYHNIAYYGGARAFEISHKGSALYIDSHPNDKDYNQDGRNDRYALTYIPAENGFRLKLDLNEVQTTDNSIHLYRIATRSIELYKAIKRLAPYATGNADERYPADTYSKFITCLTESIQLYQQYNVTLNTTDKANLSAIEKSMNDKATELRGFLSTLTKQDAVTPYIDIPVEIYDFRADGLMFEYLNAHYNLASVSAGSSLTIPGNWSNHGRINLTTGKLTNRKLSYTEQVVTFVVNSFYEEGALSNLHEGNHAPGWNSAFYDLLPTVTNTPMDKGSYNETINKTKNGGELSWSDVKTYYDLAYYLLTYMWRPVPEGDIVDTKNNLPYNVTVTERDRLRLYADENGNYVLDADNDILYDGYYTYNPTPRAKEDITYASPLFTPADGLGFETAEMITKLGGDTDRGGMYANYGTECANTNFHFTMHAYGSFVYYESQKQYFDFLGDDDVYFFIDGKIALDLGGAHQALGGRVDLNSLNLVDGEVYDFDMFYAERHTSASNLKFSTNIKIVDTDTLTTMGQYAQTYNGSSKVDAETGLGVNIIDNGAVYVGDTTAYSFDLMNTRNLPVYDISFVSPTLGAHVSSSETTLYKAALTNGAVTDIKDITIYYRTVTRDENGDNIIHSGMPVAKSYTDMKALLSGAIQNNTVLAEGSYRVPISTETELKELLKLGIPHNCQISVYGFKRNTTQNDSPFTNTVNSRCYYTRVATNEGSAGGEVFTLNGSAARKLRVSSALPSVDPQKIVLDFGKKVNIPVKSIAEQIYTDTFVTVTGLSGIVFSGNHEEVLKKAPASMVCTAVGTSASTETGVFTRTEEGLEYRLTDFMDTIETVNLVYAIEGCELADPDGTITEYSHILVQLQLIPATSMYYETDFAKGVFDLVEHSHSLFFDFGNEEADRIRYSSPTYGGYNFDQAEEGYWATRATRTDRSTASDFSIDNQNGTISIDVAPGRPHDDTSNYGPWVTTTTTYGTYPANTRGTHQALRYDPSYAEFIQIRFKVEGCSVTRNGSPRVVVVYNYMNNGTFYGRDYSMVEEYIYEEGVYQVVTLPVSETFKNWDYITSFGFRFWDLQSTNQGKVTVDYIYVGREDHLPQPESILLNFGSDDGSEWSANKSATVKKDTGAGILCGDITASDPYVSMKTTGVQWNYVPKEKDIVQLRIKVSSGAGSDIQAFFSKVGSTSYSGGSTEVVPFTPNGEYQTVRIPIPDKLIGVPVRSIRIDPVATFAQKGTYEIDYIYIGKEENAPVALPAEYLFFDFTDSAEDQLRYENPVYGGFHFDRGNWVMANGTARLGYTIDPAGGTVALNVANRTSDYGPYFATSNSYDGYPYRDYSHFAPLMYPMKGEEELRIRFKVENCEIVGSSNEKPKLGLLLHSTVSGESKYVTALSQDYTYTNGQYFELTFDLSKAYNAGDLIHSVGFRFYYLNSSSSGKITIDYIYLGPKGEMPTGEPLYVDFTNTAADQERYRSVKYNGKNLDLAENWAVNSAFKKSKVVDATGAGTMNLEQIDNYNSNGWHHLQAGTPVSPQGLNFVRSKDDVFQIRMKIEDASLLDTNNELVDGIRIGFGYAGDNSTTINYHYANVLFKDYANKGYFTLTLSLDKKETYLADTHTTTVRPYVHFIGAGSSAPAKIEIDYIYLGPKDKIEETLHSGKHVWQTITDGTSSDEYQDVDMVHGESTASYVPQSEVASEINAKPETKGKEEASRAAASIDFPNGVTVKNRTEYTLAEGVRETYITEQNNKLAIYIAEIGANSKTALKVSTPGYYTVGSTEESRVANYYSLPNNIQYVVDQAKAYEKATDEKILFAMNGSFFDGQEVNRGPLVLEGNMLQGCFGTLSGEYIFALLKDGTYAILNHTDDFSNVEEGLGARHRLIENGVNVIAGKPEADNLIHVLHPRTAIGLKADGSVVCIVVDGRSAAGYTTNGISLPDLADLMISLGCVDAVNLDGGGSSTFVTRRNANQNLAMRNKSSESAGQRPVASALLFISTEDHCQHTYANNDYRLLSEGRHELLCDICRQGIDSPHRYTNGVCVCGKQEEKQTNLLFDFANQPTDRERYNNAAYGYRNFDMPSQAKDEVDVANVDAKWTWWRGFWATQATDSDLQHRKDFVVDSNAGVLRVDVADYTGADDTGTLTAPSKPYGDSNNYGPFVMTAPYYYQWTRKNYNFQSLHYDPSNAEIVRVRFKLENCGSTNTPAVIFLANYKDGSSNGEIQLSKSYTFADADNQYVVVNVTLDDAARGRDEITSLGLRFNNIYSKGLEDSGEQGAVVIDYIYIGTKADAPTNGDLFIDFTNTKADQERYATHTFSGLNLDLAENWKQMGNYKAPVISNGIMTLTYNYADAHNGYITPGKSLEARPLNYTPSADDYLQIRFKIEDAVGRFPENWDGRLVVFYADDTGNTVPGVDDYVFYNFPKGTVLDKGWITLTLKISEMDTTGKNFTEFDSISRISPGFYWLKSAEGKFASFHIDYIYIGPEERLPSFNKPVYGYDSSYTDDSKLSNGSSLFIKGEGIPSILKDKDGTPVSIDYAGAKLYTEASFTFTGTGFDIISRTGVNQGMIRAVVFGSDGRIVKNVSVINKGESELYQIPVLSVEGLAHGTYTVKLLVDEAFDYGNDGNNDIFGGGMDRGGEFYFDAVRIYEPIDTRSTDPNSANAYEVYQNHGEADPTVTELRDILIDANSFTAGSTVNGVVYLDAMALPGTHFDTANGTLVQEIAKYRAIGPNNEVYLLPGNAIAFKLEVDGPIPASIDIGAKSANSEAVSMVVSVTSTVPSTLPTGSQRELRTSTALYYPLDILASTWKTVTVNHTETHYVYVTVYNSGAQGILSITDIKYAYDFPNPDEPVSRKAVRFVVDAPMLEMYTGTCAHTWDQGEITTAPTCTDAGIKTFTCTACGMFYTESVAATGHSYINGVCICGQAEAREPIAEPTWRINHSLNLASDISVNLVVPKTLLAGFDMNTVYMESMIETYEGNGKQGTTTVRITPVESAYYYYFTLDGLTAVQMNDKITSVLYGTKDGQIYCSPVDEYSIATYAYAQLNKTGIGESLKSLCADLLRYGAKAQLFKAYRTDTLADGNMTQEHKAYLSDIEAVTFGNTNRVLNDLENAPITWVGKALSLESKVELRFVFNPSNYRGNLSDLSLRVTYEDGQGNRKTVTVADIEAYGQGTGTYAFTVNSLLAAELRAVVSVQIYCGETPVSSTLQYSADTYGNNKTGNLLALCKALFAYSDSAKAYFQ